MGEILVGKYSRKLVKLERSFLVGKIPFKLEKTECQLSYFRTSALVLLDRPLSYFWTVHFHTF